MTDAPDKIWARYSKKVFQGRTDRGLIVDNRAGNGLLEYIRSDLTPAMLAEARAEGVREAAAIVGVEVGHKGDAENCQCGMCVARRKDHAAILALLDQPAPDRHE